MAMADDEHGERARQILSAKRPLDLLNGLSWAEEPEVFLPATDALHEVRGMVWYGMVWYGTVWYGMVWYGMVWYGMVWYGMVLGLKGVKIE